MKQKLLLVLGAIVLIAIILVLLRGCKSDPVTSIETTIDSTITVQKNSIEHDAPDSRFPEVPGRDTVLHTDTVYINAGMACSSFNFFAISESWGRAGFDTISGIADCYGRRLININVRPAPIVIEHWDTIIHVRETTREKVVEKDQPFFSISAHALYDPLHSNIGGGAEAAFRLANLQLFARPEFTLQTGSSAYVGARFFIWER